MVLKTACGNDFCLECKLLLFFIICIIYCFYIVLPSGIIKMYVCSQQSPSSINSQKLVLLWVSVVPAAFVQFPKTTLNVFFIFTIFLSVS